MDDLIGAEALGSIAEERALSPRPQAQEPEEERSTAVGSEDIPIEEIATATVATIEGDIQRLEQETETRKDVPSQWGNKKQSKAANVREEAWSRRWDGAGEKSASSRQRKEYCLAFESDRVKYNVWPREQKDT